MDKQRVYIETSFISYLTSKPNRDLVLAAHQQISREWWDKRKKDFEIFISQLVYEEAGKGDADAVKLRMKILTNIPLLELNDECMNLASIFIRENIIPRNFVEDAFHISIATIHGMDYLLTWNCKHIANAVIRGRIEKACNEAGYIIPVICTPEELLGDLT
ncbi:MAG: type II toxin-antitoxin system VapC family toxin [bacterium]